VTLDDEVQAIAVKSAELLELEEALKQLEAVDTRRAAVVECRFFGGLSVEETAVALELSTATVNRDWRIARAWLAQALRRS
jgi:DNA-directed RNA polymerase specialized sigma24 family protein